MKEKLIKLITICDKYEKEYQAATTLFNENETRKTYKNRKEDARLEAIEYQQDLSESNYSYGELIKKQSYFESLAKRYGLTEEFKENGII